MRRLVVMLAVAIAPAAAHADFRFAIGNDTFTGLVPPFDDNGFTNDIDLHFWRPVRDYLVGARILDRWITEDVPVGGRRDDVLDVMGTVQRTFGRPLLRELTPSLRVGPTFTGNLGGRWGQNGFHTLCHCGRLLDEGLQDTYVGDNDYGVLVGARVLGAAGLPWIQAYTYTDGQLSLGAGVSSFEVAGGTQLLGTSGTNRFGAHVEVAAMRFHVVDDRLAFAGSYRPGWQGAYRVGVHFARGRIRVDYEYRANEGGSGEPFGVVAVTIKQAGHTF